MLLTSSFVNGAVGGSVIFGGFRGVVGFVGIQPLSCTNRKNARKTWSFFRAAIFLFGQDARNRRTASTSNSFVGSVGPVPISRTRPLQPAIYSKIALERSSVHRGTLLKTSSLWRKVRRPFSARSPTISSYLVALPSYFSMRALDCPETWTCSPHHHRSQDQKKSKLPFVPASSQLPRPSASVSWNSAKISTGLTSSSSG